MSAVLLVTKNKRQVARVNVTGPKFTIGRGNQCDYPVDEELASRKHVEISWEDTICWVQDLGSTNGTLLNGKKITGRTLLKDGDEIGIGSTRLRFISDAVHASGAGEDDLTRPAGAASSPEARPAPSPAVQEAESGPLRVKVRISGGPLDGGVFKNWSEPLTIGRGLENHVVLPDNAVSNRHARIVQEGEAYFIEDLDSANGTFLDGVKVRRQQLANGQKIKVGISTLAFELVDLRKRRRNLKIVAAAITAVVVLAATVKLLQPPDIAGDHIERGRQFAARGELPRAFDAYQAALKLDPNRAEARKEFNKVKASLDARRMLQMAQSAAEEEKFERAKGLVYQVLREFPKHSHALELETVIKSIEDATVASRSRNWEPAVTLLEKARDKYPKSQLIATRLESAQSELMAERGLARAKEAMRYNQDEIAEGFLKVVPASSVYFTEAREHLEKIDRDRKTADWLKKSESHYRAARLPEALTEIEMGLKVAPTNAVLLDLRMRVRKMDELQGALAQAETVANTNDLEALLAGRTACDEILRIENDPLNQFRRRAQEAKNGIDERLRAMSQTFLSQAQALPEPAVSKEALRLFTLALKADPANPGAAEAANKLRDEIQRKCKELFVLGVRFEELRHRERAQECFRKILEIAPPDDDYFKKASAKLR